MNQYEIDNKIKSMSKEEKIELLERQCEVLRKNGCHIIEKSRFTMTVIVKHNELDKATALKIDDVISIARYC